MKKLLSILIFATSLNIAYAQDNLNISSLSSNAQATLKFLNDPKNKNDNLNDPQTQNDTELVMSIMKSIEDKQIKDNNKKIEFVNSFKVSSYIKDGVISLINQNITYSDHEKISYGVYGLNECNDHPRVGCMVDYVPRDGCKYQRSNICGPC